MENNLPIQLAAKEMGIALQDKDTSRWMSELEEKINNLLTADFGRLINILYRMDVSEAKLKQLLKDNPEEDAAKIIATLMVERQAEKIKTRQQFKRNTDIEDEWNSDDIN